MQLRIRGLRCTTILFLVIFLSGCAFGTRQPTLQYPPTAEPGTNTPPQTAERPAPKNLQIVLGPFTDQRSDKKVVGTVRNGFGMRTADVIPTNSVSDWVTQAMQIELQHSGYTVATAVSGGDSPPGQSVVVSGEILNVFCDMYFSYTGQVSLLTKVTKAGKEVLTKHYAGEGSAGIAWGATEESYAQSLALALASALKQFVSDLEKSLMPQ